jgi:SIT4-associating protein SAP185/190
VLTEELSQLEIDSPEQEGDEPQSEGKRRVSLLTQQLQEHIQESELNFSSDQPRTAQEDVDMHPEDRPAPLFASPGKKSQSATSSNEEDPSHSTATLQPDAPTTEGDNGLWEADVDGSPVVGDLLKIMFVEHQVVPTILVSLLYAFKLGRHTYVLGLLLPLPLEQFPAQCGIRCCTTSLQRQFRAWLQPRACH